MRVAGLLVIRRREEENRGERAQFRGGVRFPLMAWVGAFALP
jgi:hypothetical protein